MMVMSMSGDRGMHIGIIQTAGKAVELSANVWHAEETINKEEVMQIEVSLTDENGVLAAEDLEITAEVIGGTLLGLENGDLADLTPYCEAHRIYEQRGITMAAAVQPILRKIHV